MIVYKSRATGMSTWQKKGVGVLLYHSQFVETRRHADHATCHLCVSIARYSPPE